MEKETPLHLLKMTHLVISVLFAAQFFLFLSPAKAVDRNEISIDSASQSLIAPEAQYYQWYENGEVIKEANHKTFSVKKSGYYSVEMINAIGQVTQKSVMIAVAPDGTVRKIYIIGDSTVCNYAASAYPQTGWGQILPFFFDKSNVVIDNRAIGGRSSRSFYLQGRWTPIVNALLPGDFVFIQFGHNDRNSADTSRYTSPADYKIYLTKYVNDTRSKGAFPVLVSPMVMNAYSGSTLRNVFTESGNDYRGAMLQVATLLKVPFIDLNMKSFNYVKSLGQAYATRYVYHTYPAGEYPNYPNGNSDGTHFQEMGAIDMARFVVEGITELKNDPNANALITFLLPTHKVTVNTNNTAAGLVTHSAIFPAGVKVTLKTIPSAGHTFSRWTDAANTTVSQNLFTFVMGQADKTYNAFFDLGTNKAPAVTVTTPSNNAVFTAPANFTISANASDADGTVSNVQFFNGTTLLGTDVSSPYSFSLTNLAMGVYSITARATDNAGTVTTSAVVQITVAGSCTPTPIIPFVQINSGTWTQTNTANLPANGLVTFGPQPTTGGLWKWTGPNGFVSTLRQITFSNVQTGLTGNYVATYTNAAGCSSTNTFTLQVISSVNTPPSASLTAPVNNSLFTSPASVTINADAKDTDGTINKVEFYSGTTLLGFDAIAPYSFIWNNVVSGTYSITAVASDNSGAIAKSSPASITVLSLSPVIQAETACSVDGVLSESTNGGFHGSGYVNTTNTTGAALNFTLNSQIAQTTPLTIRYANASANSRSVSVNVNGVSQIANVDFISTGAWTIWNTVIIQISLESGSNNLQFVSLTSEGAPNFDEISFGTNGISVGTCPPVIVQRSLLSANPAQVIPNPSSGSFNITVSEDVQSINIIDSNGLSVFVSGPISSGENILFGDKFNSGLYVINILYASGRVESQKIQKTL